MDELRAGRELARKIIEEPADESTDYLCARRLEDEIERWGLGTAYVSALLLQIDPDSATWDITDGADEGGGWMDRDGLFRLIRATPEQRARAFLEAMKGADNNA